MTSVGGREAGSGWLITGGGGQEAKQCLVLFHSTCRGSGYERCVITAELQKYAVFYKELFCFPSLD